MIYNNHSACLLGYNAPHQCTWWKRDINHSCFSIPYRMVLSRVREHTSHTCMRNGCKNTIHHIALPCPPYQLAVHKNKHLATPVQLFNSIGSTTDHAALSPVVIIFQFKMNNSFDFDYQMRRLSIGSSDSVPPPPASLSASKMSFSSAESQKFEHDCSRFAAMTPAPSFNFLSSSHYATERRMCNQGRGSGGLSRSRCVNDFSSLGNSFSSASDNSVGSSRQTPSYDAVPSAGWGYFVDTPSR